MKTITVCTLQIKAAEVQRKYSGIAAIYYRQQQSAALSFHTNCSGSLRSLQWKYLLCSFMKEPNALLRNKAALVRSKTCEKSGWFMTESYFGDNWICLDWYFSLASPIHNGIWIIWSQICNLICLVLQGTLSLEAIYHTIVNIALD